MKFSVYSDLIQFSYHRFTFKQNEVLGLGCVQEWGSRGGWCQEGRVCGPQNSRLQVWTRAVSLSIK